jgi:hypothetical protein
VSLVVCLANAGMRLVLSSLHPEYYTWPGSRTFAAAGSTLLFLGCSTGGMGALSAGQQGA